MSADSFQVLELMLLLLAIGGVGGFLSGLLGLGGGILFVPALFFALTSMGFDTAHTMHIAVGTSLAIVLATGSTSAIAHYRRGSLDLNRVRSWGPFIVSSVVAGSFFAALVDGDILKRIFAVITFIIALYMAFGREKVMGDGGREVSLKAQKIVCLVIGAVSSMIGIGGAIMTIPFMSYIGLPIQRAIGTGAALGVLIALPGMLSYMLTGLAHAEELPPYSIGYVSFPAVLVIIPASILTASAGVQAGHNLPKTMLRRVFAVVLIIVSIRMFMSL